MTYTGWLYDTGKPNGKGTSFDSSTSFAVSRSASAQVIAGWDQGVPGMQVGGTRRLIIPPELAYGSNSRQPPAIPAERDSGLRDHADQHSVAM